MKKKIIMCVAALLLILIVGSFAYLNDYYHADAEALAAFAQGSVLERREISDTVTAYIPAKAEAGFIFYPGGKVEHTAYEPLLQACAERGILCVLVEMPYNLAVLDMDAASGLEEYFPDIDSWYIGGHSLGGAMAASYLADNADGFDGLILLASYSTADLSRAAVNVLSIYGSEDGVLDREKYTENLANLPTDFTELVIAGGNHAGFGVYGEQKDDGKASITNAEQISIAAESMAEFILK